MFIFLKLVFVFVLAAIRLSRWLPKSQRQKREWDGLEFFDSPLSYHRRSVGREYAVFMDLQTSFLMKRESFMTKTLVNLGLARDFRSGDPRLDRALHIATDDSRIMRILFSNSEVKDLIFDLSSNVGFKSLQADGRYLMIQVGPDADDRQVVKDLYRLVKILKSLGPASKRSLVERIPFRLATAEILAYGIFGYAMAYFMDFPSWDVHVFWPELVPVISAATLFVLVLWGLCLKWFVGSRTKTGMVLLETGLLLLFAAPVWGYDVAASFNRRFDRSDALSMKLENLQLEERIIRQRGSVQRRYVLRFNPVVIGGRSISKLRVPQSVFLELQSLESTLLMVRKGFLGVHWIQRIGSTDIPIKKSQFLSPKA